MQRLRYKSEPTKSAVLPEIGSTGPWWTEADVLIPWTLWTSAVGEQDLIKAEAAVHIGQHYDCTEICLVDSFLKLQPGDSGCGSQDRIR